MCGSIAISQLEIENYYHPSLAKASIAFNSAIRRCRSVGDLALAEQFTPVSPGKGRGGGLKRRISSVEDLTRILLKDREKVVMGPSELGNGIDGDKPASGKGTVLAPCEEENVGDGPSISKSSSPKDPIGDSPAVAADPSPFETAAAAIGIPFSSGPPSPLGKQSLSSASSPQKGAVFLPFTNGNIGSAINQLIGEGPSSTMSSPRTQPLPEALAQSCTLDSRRNSADLGFLAPNSSHLAHGHAAEELFYRLNHARQTVDYVKRQAATFSSLNRASMDVWEALELLNSLREYEAALLGSESTDADLPLMDHALQTAEACRLAFPDQDWMALVGLLHGLGKLLAHATFGAEPQWAICGESFPVGCRFHPSIIHSQFFQANPDRRRRGYASATGVYQPGCGLGSVCMSWSGSEYLYMVLAMNKTTLPPEALFLIRYQKFAAVVRPGQPYGELLSAFDRGMLPMLTKFREISEYRRQEVPGRLEGDELRQFYDALLAKYIPQGVLRW